MHEAGTEHAGQLPLGSSKPDGAGPQSPPLSTVEPKLARLCEPFRASLVKWRVISTTKDKARGQVAAYVSQRSYIDRLNNVFGPGGWSRELVVHSTGGFERGQNKALAVKVLVVCHLTIAGVGTHYGAGEEFADDQNALSRAEARAFKHACSCFGLGRYLYEIERPWVELDGQKKPKKLPQLPEFARPAGGGSTRGPGAGSAGDRESATSRKTA